MTGTRSRPAPARKVSSRGAARILAAADPVVARLVADAGPPILPAARETHFATLVRSVTYQQLAVAAAAAIHGRLVAALGGQAEVTPERMLATSTETLRGCGLSGGKVASLRDLAAKILDGTVVLDARRLGRQSDEEIVARLSAVRGIGKWTAEMFLIFQLRRIDVWPTGDLGVRKGFALAWNIPVPTAKELDVLGEPYRPYRSVVAWYCWRALQLYAPPPVAAAKTPRPARPRRAGGGSDPLGLGTTAVVPPLPAPVSEPVSGPGSESGPGPGPGLG